MIREGIAKGMKLDQMPGIDFSYSLYRFYYLSINYTVYKVSII